MRKALSMLTTIAIAAAVLTGCTPSQNEDAAEAAADYSQLLTSWAHELADAASAEEPLAGILAAAPKLDKVGDVENTPRYLAAQDVSEQIDVVAREVSGYGDELELFDLAEEIYLTSTLEATTSNANADRINAISDSWDLEGQPAKDAIRAAHTNYWKLRADAVDDEIALNKNKLDPAVGLQASFLAFNLNWFAEEKEFDEQILADLSTFTQFTNAYLDFSGTAGSGFSVIGPYIESKTLKTGYASLTEDFAAALADVIETGRPLGESTTLPSIADPYRTTLIDGYVPIGDENSDPRAAVVRLWMLWRIRELEKTPDAAYEAARIVLREELTRRPAGASDTTVDPRAGSARLLDVFERFAQSTTGVGSLTPDETWLTELDEVQRYAETLRDTPMIDEVAESYDEVLALQRQYIDDVTALIKTAPDDVKSQIVDVSDALNDDLYEAALSAVRYLDNDAEFSKDLTILIEATSPTASDSEES